VEVSLAPDTLMTSFRNARRAAFSFVKNSCAPSPIVTT